MNVGEEISTPRATLHPVIHSPETGRVGPIGSIDRPGPQVGLGPIGPTGSI